MQTTGLFPIRAEGHTGAVPVAGWKSGNEWTGWIPFEELPAEANPSRGAISTANQRIQSEEAEHQIGHDYSPPFRAQETPPEALCRVLAPDERRRE